VLIGYFSDPPDFSDRSARRRSRQAA